MSLVDDKRKHHRTEVTLKEKCTLLLSELVISQIAELHEKVKQVEWSGILLFKNVSGSIEDPKNWVLECTEVIPMDVGSSVYTEYEIDSADAYSTDIWMEALMDDQRMGHIHTHHNMGCFFSGTDKSELHDNAPQNNYYLSLIVNFKDPSQWKAKVAIAGSVQEVGTKKVEGEVKTITKWAASEESREDIKDLTEEVAINATRELLYMIDCDIVKTGVEPVTDNFKERIEDLLEKKRSRVTTTYYGNQYFGRGTGTAHLGKQMTLGVGVHANTESRKKATSTHAHYSAPEDNDPFEMYLEDLEQDMLMEPIADGDHPFSIAKVKPFLAKLLAQDANTTQEYTDVLLKIMGAPMNDQNLLLDQIEDNFEKMVKDHFGRKGDFYDMHAVTLSMTDILSPFNTSNFVKSFEGLFDVYIMPSNVISDEDTFKLTGVQYEDVV